MLDDELRAVGVTVKEYGGWTSTGGQWADGRPVGLMVHHTAPPVPFPVDSLAGHDQGRIKCNANVKPDGVVWLIADGACNYSSGSGSGKVLKEVRAGTPPSKNAKDRGLEDDTNGNPWFYNFEVDHEGDGGPIPEEQYVAVVTSLIVVGRHWNLTQGNTVSHAEWTARKSDPYWNNNRRCIEQIRADMGKGYDMQGPNGEPNWDEVSDWARNSWTKAFQAGLLTEDSHPGDELTVEQSMVYLARAGVI
jgi:hypothetical protein